MMLALIAIPLCILKSGGRDIENMRVIRFLVRHVKYFLGLRFEVSGWEHLQTEGPYVIISNHQSSLDVLGLMEILPDRCTMIAKKELIYAGTVGLICWLGGIVFINRKKTSDAKSVMADAAKTMLDDQIRLWVFPEGTRNQRGDLLPFKKGAFHLAVQAQAPIIPVVFSSYSNFYQRKEKQFKSGTIRLKILPKIETKGMTSDDVSSLSDKSYNLMRSAFLSISNSVTQSNGPLRQWTFTVFPPLLLLCPCLRPIPPRDLATLPRLSHRLARKQHDTGLLSWYLFLSSWRLVQSASAWPYRTVGPDPHCVCSSAALHAVSGVTDGKPNSMDVCCSSCMPFWWLCPPSLLLCSLALEAWLYYCLTLSPFCTFLLAFFSHYLPPICLWFSR